MSAQWGKNPPTPCRLPPEARPQHPRVASDCPHPHLGPPRRDSGGGEAGRVSGEQGVASGPAGHSLMASLSRPGRVPPTPHHAGGPGGLRVRNTPRSRPAGGAQSRRGEVLRLPAVSARRPPGFTSSRSPRRPGGPGTQRSAAPAAAP